MESAEILGEPKEVHADAVRADLLELGEGNDYATCRRVVEKVLGRRFHGALPLHPSYVPARCPADAMPQSGCYVKRKRWTDTLHLGYEPGAYLSPANPNTPAPGRRRWRPCPVRVVRHERPRALGVAQRQRPPAGALGFEKKNCAREYVICDERGAARDAGAIFVAPPPSPRARAPERASGDGHPSAARDATSGARTPAAQVSGPTRYAAPAFFFSKPVNVGWRPAVARHSALPRSEKSAKAGDEPGVGPTTT
ncbi:hypothetical protein JL721_11889 [Aureococcus anophagefferens]|nr:hypothetical protein JL721_11889 [Aureococcus anophagefferens]